MLAGKQSQIAFWLVNVFIVGKFVYAWLIEI